MPSPNRRARIAGLFYLIVGVFGAVTTAFAAKGACGLSQENRRVPSHSVGSLTGC